MIDHPELQKRFDEFIHSIERGEIVTDAILVVSALNPEQVDGDTTSYQQVVFGKASIHRCVGLLEVAKHEMLTQDDD